MQIDTNTLNIRKYELFYNTTAISISTMQLIVIWITRFCLFIIIFLSDLNWAIFLLGYIVAFKKCLWKYVCVCVWSINGTVKGYLSALFENQRIQPSQ